MEQLDSIDIRFNMLFKIFSKLESLINEIHNEINDLRLDLDDYENYKAEQNKRRE